MGSALASPAWLLILLMVALGKLFRQRRTLPPAAPDVLNGYVIDIALPALIFVSVRNLAPGPELAWLILTPWLLLLPVAAAILALARLWGWARPVTGTLLLCVPLGNTAFLGFPLVEAMIGAPAVPAAVVYDQFGTFLILSSYGLLIAALFGSGARPTLGRVLGDVVRFPPFVVLVLALLPIPWPKVLGEVAAMIAATLVPVACFAVGLQLRLRIPAPLLPALGTGLTLKLLAMPLAALVLLTATGIDGTLRQVGVLESAMPPMITAGALAARSGMDRELAAGLVGFGILLSFLTAPLLLRFA